MQTRLLKEAIGWGFLLWLIGYVRYYKLDVYLYYALTFLLPVAVGWWRTRRVVGPRLEHV